MYILAYLTTMTIGMIGLGRMGCAISKRLLKAGHTIHGFDVSKETCLSAQREGVIISPSLEALVSSLPEPRVIWVMLPAGDVTHDTLHRLSELLSPKDIVIDGGNSYFADSEHHFYMFQENQIQFIDCGTSGGLKGEEIGFALMLGGEQASVEYLQPIWQDLATEGGYAHIGQPGSGHYTKMVHNGIEYGIMEAMAEGFEMIKSGPYEGLDLTNITKVWKNGSIIRSFLMDLAHQAFIKDPNLDAHTDYVDDNGMGRWTVHTAIEHAIPAPVITDAVYARFRSRQDESFAGKSLAALRNEFGGHPVQKKEKK